MEAWLWGGRVLLPSPLGPGAAPRSVPKPSVGWVILTGWGGAQCPSVRVPALLQEVDAQTVREVCSKYFYDQCPAVAAVGE